VEGVCVVHQGCFLSGLDGVMVKGSNLGMMSHHSYLSCDLQILGEKTPFIPTRPCLRLKLWVICSPSWKKKVSEDGGHYAKIITVTYLHSWFTHSHYGKWGRVSGLQHD